MEELKLGKITLKELASWFGISYGSIRNKREKYFQELEEYANFKAGERGGVEILNIYIPVYIKKDNNYQQIKQKIPATWDKSGLDLKKNVAQKLYSKEEFSIKYSTVYSYVCKASNELYGKPSSLEGGEIGNCHWVLCVKDQNTGKLRWFTYEENQQKQELRAKYFNERNQEEKKKQEIRESLKLQLKKNEISKEDYKEELFVLEESAAYDNYLEALQNILPKNDILAYGICVEEYINTEDFKF